jgi:prophage DNA circulation protein
MLTALLVMLLATVPATTTQPNAAVAVSASRALRNATAVLVKPTKGWAKLAQRWKAIQRQPWVDSVDHIVFVERRRLTKSDLDALQLAMDKKAIIIDVSAEWDPGLAKKNTASSYVVPTSVFLA